MEENKKELSENFSLEIDCAPGGIRPDDILPSALNETEMKEEDFEITSKVFGNWTFIPLKEKEELYKTSQSKIAENLKSIYGSGRIRYASW